MKCAICGKEIIGFGNDPWPVRIDESAECCDDCNDRFVTRYRIMMLHAPNTKFSKTVPAILNTKSYEELINVEIVMSRS